MTVRIETNYKDLTIIKMNFSEIATKNKRPQLQNKKEPNPGKKS